MSDAHTPPSSAASIPVLAGSPGSAGSPPTPEVYDPTHVSVAVDDQTLESWVIEFLTDFNVLLSNANVTIAIMKNFGAAKFQTYVEGRLASFGDGGAQHEAAMLVLIRHAVLTSPSFTVQQQHFANEFKNLVCRKIVVTAMSYDVEN